MPVMPVQLRPLARQDLLSIWRYSADHWGKTQADKYLRALEQCFQKLAKHPQIGRNGDYIQPGLMLLPFKQHIILYQRTTQPLCIVRVLHQRMDIKQQSNLSNQGS